MGVGIEMAAHPVDVAMLRRRRRDQQEFVVRKTGDGEIRLDAAAFVEEMGVLTLPADFDMSAEQIFCNSRAASRP